MSGSMPQFTPEHGQLLASAHQNALAMYGKTSEAMGRFAKIQQGLGKLATLGDSITPEDVIKEAGVLVGHGESPQQLAALMADMPTSSGEALAGWVAQHLQMVQQNVAKMQQVHAGAQHEMGVSALHALAADGQGGAPTALSGGGNGPSAPNALTSGPSPLPSLGAA